MSTADDGIVVLSLFDGMSCGRIALERAGVKVKQYYAAEIDKHAIAVAQANYPNTIQLGSVTGVSEVILPKVDLLIGGSPCQSFSFAGKMAGMATTCNQEILTLEQYLDLKKRGFAFQGQSYLFWEYVRILKGVQPEYFLLENVMMQKKWQDLITGVLGVQPVKINSALVSAQNRKRLYWTNIPGIRQPEDLGILLKDILEEDVDEKYHLTDKMLKGLITASNRAADKGNGYNFKATSIECKSATIRSGYHKMGTDDPYVVVAQRGRPDATGTHIQQLEPNTTGKTNTPTSVQKDNLIMQINPSKEGNGGRKPAILVPEATKKGYVEIQPGECFDAQNINSSTRRGRKMADKSNCLMAKETDFMKYTADLGIRRLTPTECERLQTVPEGYTAHVSDTQRYRMLGNGWTVDVVAHIFKSYKNELILKQSGLW